MKAEGKKKKNGSKETLWTTNYYLMQPYATKPCNDNWLAAKYLQLIIPGLYVAIGLLQVAPWRARGQEDLDPPGPEDARKTSQ